MDRTYGNWKVGSHSSVVVTDERPERFSGDFEKDSWEKYELEHCGGYVICESISRPADAYVIAAASDLNDACCQILNGLDSFDLVEFFHGINAARLSVSKANPPKIRIPEFSQSTINRIVQIMAHEKRQRH